MPYRRLLIIQLDSLPWSVLRPLMEEGDCPTLQALCASGCTGTLRSTVPPITPAAWATFMSGVRPGRHGILNFKGFDPVLNAYRLSDSRHLQERNIYKILSDGGLRVGVVMQPAVHPPFEVNGFVLSGFDSPGLGAGFAWPPALEGEILRLCPEHQLNFNLHKLWREESSAASGGEACLAANLADAAGQMRRVVQLALDLAARDPVEVLCVYLQAPDVVLHKAWRWCLPASGGPPAPERELVKKFFREMDALCGRLLACPQLPPEERLVLVLSDHGHQAAEYSVFANTILHGAGLLRYASGTALLRDGFRRVRDLTRGIRRKGLGRPIDWDRTAAFLPYQACSGFVYLNLRGRQPYGSVRPEDYERVRDEVMALFRGVRLPEGGPAFAEVLAGEAFFEDKQAMQAPDIVLVQGKGVDIKRGAGSGSGIRARPPQDGIHHPDGMYILHGNGVAAGGDHDAGIIDMAPTLLAAMGQAVPGFMEGQALLGCFTDRLEVRTREWPWKAARPPQQSAYSAEQEAQVEERLADLGYLE